jgi:hypothetical protein
MGKQFRRIFSNFGELGQISVELGLERFHQGKYKEAYDALKPHSINDEAKSALIKCCYMLGRESAGRDEWGLAKKYYGTLLELGERGLLVQERLRLISLKTRIAATTKNYYEIGKSNHKFRTPHISKDIYRPEIDGVICVGIYKWVGDSEAYDDWSKLLRRIKSGSADSLTAAEIAGITLLQCIAKETAFRECIDLIVPVPPDPDRIKERTFNIPSVLAKKVSELSTIPMFEGIVVKTRSTQKRAGFHDLLQVLTIRDEASIKGRNLIVIDDITTHGHTFRTCGYLLRKAGAAKVFAAALAHSEPTQQW